jgi:hypothetical protein
MCVDRLFFRGLRSHFSLIQKCLPSFDVQLGGYRWNAGLVPYDPRWQVVGKWYFYFVLTHVLQDTYTAQATVGDVNKGLTNHKVAVLCVLSCKLIMPTIAQNLESSDTALLAFGNYLLDHCCKTKNNILHAMLNAPTCSTVTRLIIERQWGWGRWTLGADA